MITVFFSVKVVSRVHRVVKKNPVANVRLVGPEHRSSLPLPGGEGKWNPWEEDDQLGLLHLQKRREAFRLHQQHVAKNKPQRYRVQIWGKAAIGLYLWEHILDGTLSPPHRTAQWREGEVVSGNTVFSFYTGPAVVQGHLPLDTAHIVLVLNGHEEQKISYATRWMQHVGALSRAGSVLGVAIVLLGDEHCTNDWLRPYLRSHGGFVDCLFLVYDSPWVNEHDVLQWPLGVATYRDFPVVVPNSQLVNTARPYLCNFMGTVYKNSSRETMMKILKQGWEKECLTSTRDKWLPLETAESLQQYHDMLAQSDLTLCPVGINAESYRIFEACSLGSVPVVEDVAAPGGCVGGPAGPLRLLKAQGAPFLFLRDWRELPGLLERERTRNEVEKAERRRHLLEWYAGFREAMRERFTETLERAFFRHG
ncbi:ribitol-5-phosphate xylosyltransferase 1 isoform X2 [Brienomyrus brachyistius]|uniref:ribitol-5-phosphate xylosyltransferase 1 isoform X2 n=1 Tax=Brienomyrus brachyistius TaxID=42636 RepID=UPI0020B338CE|nr:ribitol-5-phosphate xylosyltransferase 1 isoform X2 [Brienomyrus brachyistius]